MKPGTSACSGRRTKVRTRKWLPGIADAPVVRCLAADFRELPALSEPSVEREDKVMVKANDPQIPVFISSAHYGLEDLRSELASYLSSEFGVTPYVSSEAGFPYYHDTSPPYVDCLKAVEDCLLFIGIIDRRYGRPFLEWGPYPQYTNLSPTDAEFSHAMALGKRMLVYVRDEIWSAYNIYRANNRNLAGIKLPPSMEEQSIRFFEKVKTANPAPWIEKFSSVVEIKDSVRKRLLHEIYRSLKLREDDLRASSEDIIQKISTLSPNMQQQLAQSVDSRLSTELVDVQAKILALEEKRAQLGELQQSTQDLEQCLEALAIRKAKLDEEKLKSEMRAVQAFIYVNMEKLTREFVASPHVLPHVTDAQLAISGMAYTGYSQGQPRLDRVTYQRVPMMAENGAWRGCHAVLQFFGAGFAPTCKIEIEGGGGMNFVNKWSGHYLEICVSDAEFAPFQYLHKKFRVVNPWIHKATDWVEFSYDYDLDAEKAKIDRIYESAMHSLEKGNANQAYTGLSSALNAITLLGLSDKYDVVAMEEAQKKARLQMQQAEK